MRCATPLRHQHSVQIVDGGYVEVGERGVEVVQETTRARVVDGESHAASPLRALSTRRFRRHLEVRSTDGFALDAVVEDIQPGHSSLVRPYHRRIQGRKSQRRAFVTQV
jgi:hypothetical protein